MYRKLTILFFSFLSVFNGNAAVPKRSSSPTTIYLPLAVGNTWEYRISGFSDNIDSIKLSVIGRVYRNDKEYFQLRGLPSGRDTGYVRMNKGGDLLELQGDSEIVLLKFSAENDSICGSAYGEDLIMHRNNDSVQTSAGTFLDCIVIETRRPFPGRMSFPFTRIRITYCPDIGMIDFLMEEEVMRTKWNIKAYHLH